jgi:hypothetical protein
VVGCRTTTGPTTPTPSLAKEGNRFHAPALKALRASFLAEFTLSTQSEIPSLRSGQALRSALDDSEGLGMTARTRFLRKRVRPGYSVSQSLRRTSCQRSRHSLAAIRAGSSCLQATESRRASWPSARSFLLC